MFDKYVNESQWANLYDYMADDMKEYFKDVIYPGYNELDGKLYFISTCGTTCRLFLQRVSTIFHPGPTATVNATF